METLPERVERKADDCLLTSMLVLEQVQKVKGQMKVAVLGSNVK